MLLALLAVAVLAPGSLAPGAVALRRAPSLGRAAAPDPAPARDPCGGREGWVGDGEGGRDPPPCEEADADGGDDPAGLHEPDWLRTTEDDRGDEPAD